MRVRHRLKHLKPIYLLVLMIFAALMLSACATQPAPPPPVEQGEGDEIYERASYDLDGFPPTIPHEIENRSECLACHREGEVGQTPKTPHPEHTYCRQCHGLEQ